MAEQRGKGERRTGGTPGFAESVKKNYKSVIMAIVAVAVIAVLVASA